MKNAVDRELSHIRQSHIKKMATQNKKMYDQYLNSGAQYKMSFIEFKRRLMIKKRNKS